MPGSLLLVRKGVRVTGRLAVAGVGVSVGLALGPADGDDPVRLLQAADVAMYADKGRARP